MPNDRELDKNLKLIAKSSLIIFLGILISKICFYIYRIIVANKFGPEIYGFFSIALMVSSCFIVLSIGGLSEGIVRFISYYRGKNDKRKIKTIFGFSITTVIITSLIAGIIMFFSSEFFATLVFHNPKLTIFLQLFSITIPLSAITNIFLGMMKSFEKISAYSFGLNIINPIIRVIILILLIFWGMNSNSISFSIIIATFSAFLFSYFFCKKYLFKIFINTKKEKNKKLIKELLKYSIPLTFSLAIIFIFGWIDTFMIGYFKGAVEVGIYNIALPIAMLLMIAPTLFLQLFFPIINKEYSRKRMHVIKDLSKQVGKWIFIINLPILFLFLFFPGRIINFLFNPEYLSAQTSLILLAIGFFISAQSEISLNLLGMLKKSNLRLFDIILTLILAIVLNFILIPLPRIFFLDNSLGILGAAIATMISYFFYSALLIFQAYYYLKTTPIKKEMLRVLFSGVIPAIIVLLVKKFIRINLFNLILLGSFFLLSYILLIFLTKSLDKNDFLILTSIKRKISFVNHFQLFQ